MDQINARAPEERGAGGKLRKPPPRKLPASPYARPPETARRCWISKLVDPACRLIAGGATRILPSFFSKTASGAAALSGPTSATEDRGNWRTGEQGHTDDGCESDLHLLASKSTEMASIGDISDKLRSSSDFILHRHKKGKQSEKNRFADIEQLVKGNQFSRDEFNHLVEVLNSREMDFPNVEQGKENASLTARKYHEGHVLAHRFPKISNGQWHGELNEAIWESSTPFGLSKVRDEIGASPVEIARAFMDSRAAETSPSSKSMIQTVESTMLHGDEAAIKSYDPSPSLKSSTCWPGAVVQDAYVTPQSQRSTYGLHNLPRTPYSRTLLSKSKSRLTHIQGDYNRISSTSLRQSQNTLYLQDKSKVDALENGYGSVGPIRQIRRKVSAQSCSRRPAYSSLNDLLQGESSDINEGLFMPAVKKSLEADGKGTHRPMGFQAGVPTVHMHASSMARKILEHIDRRIPTPKEKSAELKLATKWKNPESSVDVSTGLSNEGLLKLKDVSPYKYDGLDGKKSTLRNEDQGNFHVDILRKESTDKSIDFRKKVTLASDTNVCNSILRLGNDARTLQNSGGCHSFLMKSTEEDALKTLPFGGHPCVLNQEKNPLSNSSASKTVLPPISINKPDSRWTVASDNSSGFTFPVSVSPSVLSEPPTPSIMPSFSTGDRHQSKERSTELSYSFGLERSSPALVFSFPSTSSTAVHNDTGAIEFNFGSDEMARLSFSSFGKNTVCC